MSKFTKALEKIQKARNTQQEDELLSQTLEKAEDGHPQLPNLEDPFYCSGEGMPQGAIHPRIVLKKDPHSMASEQFRVIRTNLKANLAQTKARVILITSSIQGEGKTVTTTNLALAFAQEEKKNILLVDADLRRGMIGSYLGLGERKGLADLLVKKARLPDVLVKGPAPHLSVITRGDFPENPSELLDSHEFDSLMSRLRHEFELIFVDAPSVLPIADAAILASKVDSAIFVVRFSYTSRQVIGHALRTLRQSKAPLAGFILTSIDMETPGASYAYYGPYGGYYGYEKHGSNADRQRG